MRRSLREDAADVDDGDKTGTGATAAALRLFPLETMLTLAWFCWRSCMMRLAYISDGCLDWDCFFSIDTAATGDGGLASARRFLPPMLRSTEPLPAAEEEEDEEDDEVDADVVDDEELPEEDVATDDVGTLLCATGGLLSDALSRGVLVVDGEDDDDGDAVDGIGGGGDEDSACNSGLSINPLCRCKLRKCRCW